MHDVISGCADRENRISLCQTLWPVTVLSTIASFYYMVGFNTSDPYRIYKIYLASRSTWIYIYIYIYIIIYMVIK